MGVRGSHGPDITADPLTSRSIHAHPNARLTPFGREWLLRGHIDRGEYLANRQVCRCSPYPPPHG